MSADCVSFLTLPCHSHMLPHHEGGACLHTAYSVYMFSVTAAAKKSVFKFEQIANTPVTMDTCARARNKASAYVYPAACLTRWITRNRIVNSSAAG